MAVPFEPVLEEVPGHRQVRHALVEAPLLVGLYRVHDEFFYVLGEHLTLPGLGYEVLRLAIDRKEVHAAVVLLLEYARSVVRYPAVLAEHALYQRLLARLGGYQARQARPHLGPHLRVVVTVVLRQDRHNTEYVPPCMLLDPVDHLPSATGHERGEVLDQMTVDPQTLHVLRKLDIRITDVHVLGQSEHLIPCHENAHT